MTMNKQITLKEILITKVIRNLAIAAYYWLWARTDWKDSYVNIQHWIGTFLVIFCILYTYRMRKFAREHFDELAEKNLNRCNAICYKIMFVIAVITAYYSGIVGHGTKIGTGVIGWILMIAIVVVSIVRVILFSVMDSKGV